MTILIDLWKQPAVDDFGNRKRVMRDCAVEFLATTLFVWCGTLGAVSSGHKLVAQGTSKEDVARILPIAITFGVSILAMVHSIGHLSGGHMNPGVSLLMYFRRQMSGKKMLCYWLSQFLGAMLASSIVWGCTNGTSSVEGIGRPPSLLGATTMNESLSNGNGFFLEFMGSLVFYFVIAQTALDERGIAKTSFPAIPIGLVLTVVHICLIPYTGCGVNPARTFGPSMVVCMSDKENCDEVVSGWYFIYWIGPFAASWVVAELTNIMQCDVDSEEVASAELTKEVGEEVEADDQGEEAELPEVSA